MDTRKRHPAVTGLHRWFSWSHLPAGLPREVSRTCAQLHEDMLDLIEEDDPELIAGLRKLLEAKDCFVRAAIAQTEFRAVTEVPRG